jgi:hypothetical protein
MRKDAKILLGAENDKSVITSLEETQSLLARQKAAEDEQTRDEMEAELTRELKKSLESAVGNGSLESIGHFQKKATSFLQNFFSVTNKTERANYVVQIMNDGIPDIPVSFRKGQNVLPYTYVNIGLPVPQPGGSLLQKGISYVSSLWSDPNISTAIAVPNIVDLCALRPNTSRRYDCLTPNGKAVIQGLADSDNNMVMNADDMERRVLNMRRWQNIRRDQTYDEVIRILIAWYELGIVSLRKAPKYLP